MLADGILDRLIHSSPILRSASPKSPGGDNESASRRSKAAPVSSSSCVTLMACPLCGAQPDGQHHDATCDGNVNAVTQAAAAEIAKIRLLQSELQGTVTALTKEQVEVATERKSVEGEWRKYQKQIETALSPDFSEARKLHSALVEKRSNVQQAIALYKRIQGLKRRLDEPTPTVPPDKPAEKEDTPEVDQYIPKSVLGAFSKTVELILKEWHFPDATNVYFDEGKRGGHWR